MTHVTPIPDYWLCKLFFDLYGDPELAAEYRQNRSQVLARYPLSDAAYEAVLEDDVATLLNRSNGFLLRYYFQTAGYPQQKFVDALKALQAGREQGESSG